MTTRAWKLRGGNAGGTRHDHFDKLVLKAMGDHSQVERLINYELRRSPNLSRADELNPVWTSRLTFLNYAARQRMQLFFKFKAVSQFAHVA